MRGEYCRGAGTKTKKMELPPRARRIHVIVVKILRVRGTTSACAENTGFGFDTGRGVWNYLRVRGEYRSWS